MFDIATAFGNDTICNKDTSELLVGLPFNDGVFTGNGISSNIMNPQLLNTGEHVITYTRTVRSCMTDTRDTLWVNPNPLAAIGNLGAICDNTPIQTLNQGSPAGGYFFGTQILNDSGHEDPNIWREEIQIEQDPSEGIKIIDYFIKEDLRKS